MSRVIGSCEGGSRNINLPKTAASHPRHACLLSAPAKASPIAKASTAATIGVSFLS